MQPRTSHRCGPNLALTYTSGQHVRGQQLPQHPHARSRRTGAGVLWELLPWDMLGYTQAKFWQVSLGRGKGDGDGEIGTTSFHL